MSSRTGLIVDDESSNKEDDLNKKSEEKNSSSSSSSMIPLIATSAVRHTSSIATTATADAVGSISSYFSKNNNENGVPCRGHDFNLGHNTIDDIVKSMLTTGFQATNIGLAIEQIHAMRRWRWSDEKSSVTTMSQSHPNPNDDEYPVDIRRKVRARIFLGYTSNQISSGQREVIRFLVQHRMVDVIVTTAGGIEEDIIKCLRPTYMGDFKLSGKELRSNGINRIGNLLVPNANYCDFEDWVTPHIHAMHDEQEKALSEWNHNIRKQNNDASSLNSESDPPPFLWTPSKVIERLGRELNHDDSVLTWAARHQIPIFCPALTDGSLGDMLYFHSYRRPGFVLDILQDIRRLNDLAVQSHATGMVILGGGLVKHHICNANLMRNGADFSVLINTGQEFDGSDSGASPDEAISWGKIRMTANPVKVCADATVVFPLIVSQTFAKDVDEWKKSVDGCVCWASDLDTT
jgi:deoxyhypusine synthase